MSVERVRDKLNGEIKTFLDEIINGTSNYRSVSNFAEQTAHQYHGRFLIELLQNAHDALLLNVETNSVSSRIEISLIDDISEYGTLYIANDGKQFSDSNFISLSSFAQSDKKPEEDIGNKGLGFRSVLEIALESRIFSRSKVDAEKFDGFCFGFSPCILEKFHKPVLNLLLEKDDAISPFGNMPLLEWNGDAEKFRFRTAEHAKKEGKKPEDWLIGELGRISPYQLPFPLRESDWDEHVVDFEKCGFATLICLPLKSMQAHDVVLQALKKCNADMLLFLSKVSSLTVRYSNSKPREFFRKPNSTSSQAFPKVTQGHTIVIGETGNDAPRTFRLWEHTLNIAEAPEGIQDALQELPGNWKELKEASIALAVEETPEPKTGTLCIFLPTELSSGCGAHINGTFYGDLSRTGVDFGYGSEVAFSPAGKYNRYLLSQAAKLALEVIQSDLAGDTEHSVVKSQAIVDLLAPCDNGVPSMLWKSVLETARKNIGLDWCKESWFLTNKGWLGLGQSYLLPENIDFKILTDQTLRGYVSVPIFHHELDSRREGLISLSEKKLELPLGTLAKTVEDIASILHTEKNINWNNFLEEVFLLFRNDITILCGKRILPCSDGNLHGEKECSIFFPPRQGSSDEDDADELGDARDIPIPLQQYVAFLRTDISVAESQSISSPSQQMRNKLTASRLAREFRREYIFRDCLLQLASTLPLSYEDSNSTLYSSVMHWGLRLAAGTRGDVDNTLASLVSKMPVPCVGGWYAMGDAHFGPGWAGTLGDIVNEYLCSICGPLVDEARNRILLPPSAPEWGGNITPYIDLLRKAGVREGIPLFERELPSCSAQCKRLILPSTPPDGYPQELWQRYCLQPEARPQAKFNNTGWYQVDPILILPGLDAVAEFDTNTAHKFMQAVFNSLPHWKNWISVDVKRTFGSFDSIKLDLSPLAFALREIPWLILGTDGERYSPCVCWHIRRSILYKREKFFAHLQPLPLEMAQKLEANPSLKEAMRTLDLNFYDPDLETAGQDARLLTALAKAVADSTIFHTPSFVGQIHDAWHGFSSNYPLPESIIVRRGAQNTLILWDDDDSDELYLPDTEQSIYKNIAEFDKPVAVMEGKDAKRLAEAFTRTFPQKIICLSDLRLRPITDGFPWNEEGKDHLIDSELKVLIPYLLAVVAFCGAQTQGTGTKNFTELMDTLRTARLKYVTSLEVEIVTKAGTSLPPQPLSAWWHANTKTLLLRSDWHENYRDLADAFAAMSNREDIDKDIHMLLMSIMPQWDQYDSSKNIEFEESLKNLRLTSEHLLQTLALWQEDASVYIARIEPLFMLTKNKTACTQLQACDSQQALEEFLHNYVDETIDGCIVYDIMKKTNDDFGFALHIYDEVDSSLKSILTLTEWNRCRQKLGLSPLCNIDASEEFNNHREEAIPLLLCFCAYLFSKLDIPHPFAEAVNCLISLECPENTKYIYWTVPLQLPLEMAQSLFRAWGATTEQITAISLATSCDDLRNRLITLGVCVEQDPRVRLANNKDLVAQEVEKLRPICMAWALQNKLNHATYEARLAEWQTLPEFSVEAYLNKWTRTDIRSLLATLLKDILPNVADALYKTHDTASLLTHLGLTDDDLKSARTGIEAQQEEARRAKLKKVCGVTFDPQTNDRAALWKHICEYYSDEAVKAATGISLNQPSTLGRWRSSKSSSSEVKGGNKNGGSRGVMSNAAKELIGFAGEIHTFRMLQKQYGNIKVPPTAWVSGNGKYVYSENVGDDTKGCDFEFFIKGKKYHIEVKSTESENEEFTLGTSEIRLAEKLAQKKNKKSAVFYIMRVFNALSEHPTFQLLPNPYEPAHRDKYQIDRGEVRIRYRTAIG